MKDPYVHLYHNLNCITYETFKRLCYGLSYHHLHLSVTHIEFFKTPSLKVWKILNNSGLVPLLDVFNIQLVN